jgi:hypothetical protein
MDRIQGLRFLVRKIILNEKKITTANIIADKKEKARVYSLGGPAIKGSLLMAVK